jgi:hypothetical protein
LTARVIAKSEGGKRKLIRLVLPKGTADSFDCAEKAGENETVDLERWKNSPEVLLTEYGDCLASDIFVLLYVKHPVCQPFWNIRIWPI